MRLFHLAIAAAILAASATAATAQGRVALTPSATDQAAAANVSPGQAAIDRATAAKKYAFIFFWKEKNQQTNKAWDVFQPAAAKLADSIEVASIQITDPAEKRLVNKYGVSRAPMPLVLAVAPCGAITKAFTKAFDENQLRTAFVSPGTQLCLKALQARKLVFICVVDQANPQADAPATIPQGVKDFKADKKYGPATEIVLVSARAEDEAAFLKDFKVDPQTPKPVVVFLAPPGAVIGKFDGAATKQQIMAKLVSSQLDPCAGGKRGPGGCCP